MENSVCSKLEVVELKEHKTDDEKWKYNLAAKVLDLEIQLAASQLTNSQLRVNHRSEVAALTTTISQMQADFTAALSDRQQTINTMTAAKSKCQAEYGKLSRALSNALQRWDTKSPMDINTHTVHTLHTQPSNKHTHKQNASVHRYMYSNCVKANEHTIHEGQDQVSTITSTLTHTTMCVTSVTQQQQPNEPHPHTASVNISDVPYQPIAITPSTPHQSTTNVQVPSLSDAIEDVSNFLLNQATELEQACGQVSRLSVCVVEEMERQASSMLQQQVDHRRLTHSLAWLQSCRRDSEQRVAKLRDEITQLHAQLDEQTSVEQCLRTELQLALLSEQAQREEFSKQIARLAVSRQELLDNIGQLEEQNKDLQRHLVSSAEQVRQVEEEVARLEEAKYALMEAVEAERERVKEVEERERRLQLLHDGLESEIRCVQAEHTNTLAQHEVSQAQLHAANSCLQRTSQANEQLNQAAEQLKKALQSCQSKCSTLSQLAEKGEAVKVQLADARRVVEAREQETNWLHDLLHTYSHLPDNTFVSQVRVDDTSDSPSLTQAAADQVAVVSEHRTKPTRHRVENTSSADPQPHNHCNIVTLSLEQKPQQLSFMSSAPGEPEQGNTMTANSRGATTVRLSDPSVIDNNTSPHYTTSIPQNKQNVVTTIINHSQSDSNHSVRWAPSSETQHIADVQMQAASESNNTTRQTTDTRVPPGSFTIRHTDNRTLSQAVMSKPHEAPRLPSATNKWNTVSGLVQSSAQLQWKRDYSTNEPRVSTYNTGSPWLTRSPQIRHTLTNSADSQVSHTPSKASEATSLRNILQRRADEVAAQTGSKLLRGYGEERREKGYGEEGRGKGLQPLVSVPRTPHTDDARASVSLGEESQRDSDAEDSDHSADSIDANYFFLY